MTYASLWSLSYFTFTLKQLLKPDTREYVYTKIWALHRYSFWCRSADFEICLWVIIALQITQSYFVSATKSCTYSQLSERVLVTGLVGWPWFLHGNHDFEEWHHGWPWSTKVHLTMVTMADHQPWYIWQCSTMVLLPWSTMVCEMAPQSAMVDHAPTKLLSTMLNHGLWNGTSVNHGCPCSGQAFHQPWLTMLWPSFHQPWLTMLWLSFH